MRDESFSCTSAKEAELKASLEVVDAWLKGQRLASLQNQCTMLQSFVGTTGFSTEVISLENFIQVLSDGASFVADRDQMIRLVAALRQGTYEKLQAYLSDNVEAWDKFPSVDD
ncbi:hypothetical protein BGZ76_008857 [Entomortierella beljakovae]|nr:hypothetical protein BGZ76_008857 [Entomortierella beljakovae]